MKQGVIIVIPIYKRVPDNYEKQSFSQCIKVLGRRTFSLCTFRELDISYYECELKRNKVSYKITYFDKRFFDSIDGYNELLLSVQFYRRYKKYSYLLIYQLDAYVFNDALDEWILKGYDYVGAPWFVGFGKYENGCKLWAVGNGGFSLRRTKWFLKELNSLLPFFPPKGVLKNYHIWSVGSFFAFLCRCFGYKNTTSSFFINNKLNEDLMCFYVNQYSWRHFAKMPMPEEAARFSFECSPKYLFSITDGLPMGCHAWMKYQYDDFWKQYIPIKQ